jgi:2-keto-3-deoxy-L-rhamnonate aldolase RhmA
VEGIGELRRALRERACFGIFLKLPRSEVVDLLAIAGLDFVICDMEHAQISEPEARVVIKACAAVGLPVTVRLPDPVPGIVNRLLEAGATGIHVPRLRRSSDTKALYAMTHFPPLGSRSVGTANSMAAYGRVSLARYLADSNESTLTIGQFETREIDQPIDDMMEGLDVAFIGPTDLSVDFGAPGASDNPAVVSRIRDIEAAALRTKTHMGGFANSAEEALRLAARGYRYLAVGGDISLLGAAARSLAATLHRPARETDLTAEQTTSAI